LAADGLQRRHKLATGVVHQPVDRAVFTHDGCHRLFDRRLLADVAHLEADFAAILRNLVRHLLEFLDLAPH
jgi:hypothetical protein